MALTPGGTPYVEASDLVADYPATSLALAEHIDDIGKILQVVRATDSTNRSTTSASFVDVTGMSVTITPQKSDSAVLIIASFGARANRGSAGDNRGQFTITDASNNAISGAQILVFGTSSVALVDDSVQLFAYATPATTSAVTFKLRFNAFLGGNTISVENNSATGQMYAIEVSA